MDDALRHPSIHSFIHLCPLLLCYVYVQAYEAYVIYAFVQYCISYMGNEEQLSLKLQTKPAILGRHMVPFCCLPPWTMGAEFLTKCKLGEEEEEGRGYLTREKDEVDRVSFRGGHWLAG